MDTLLLSNEMCGEGLTETDGKDYRISHCKACRQSAWGGARLEAADPSVEEPNNDSESGQQSLPVPTLSPSCCQGTSITSSRLCKLAVESLGCMRVLFLHQPNTVRVSDWVPIQIHGTSPHPHPAGPPRKASLHFWHWIISMAVPCGCKYVLSFPSPRTAS